MYIESLETSVRIAISGSTIDDEILTTRRPDESKEDLLGRHGEDLQTYIDDVLARFYKSGSSIESGTLSNRESGYDLDLDTELGVENWVNEYIGELY